MTIPHLDIRSQLSSPPANLCLLVSPNKPAVLYFPGPPIIDAACPVLVIIGIWGVTVGTVKVSAGCDSRAVKSGRIFWRFLAGGSKFEKLPLAFVVVADVMNLGATS